MAPLSFGWAGTSRPLRCLATAVTLISIFMLVKFSPFVSLARLSSVGPVQAKSTTLDAWLTASHLDRCLHVNDTNSAATPLVALEKLVADEVRVRLLFIGDSQTRHLFCQFCDVLYHMKESWWNGSRTHLTRPPTTRSRFAFAWLVKTWPQPFFDNNVTLKTPRIVVKYLAVEYASPRPWVLSVARQFRPTHVVVGRGCWDIIRRVPHTARFRALSAEFLLLFKALSELTEIKRIFVFPHLRVGLIKDLSPAIQRATSPWTYCVANHLQDAFWRVIVSTAAESTSKMTIPVTLLEACRLSLESSLQAADGLHYDAPPVVDRLVLQLLVGLASGRNERYPCPSSNLAGQFQEAESVKLPHECLRAEATYRERVLQSVILPRSRRMRLSLEASEEVLQTYFDCLNFEFAVWRFLGPSPWLHDDSLRQSEGLRDQCDAVKTYVYGNASLARLSLSFLSAAVAEGSGEICKAIPAELLARGGETNNAGVDGVRDIRCLNEPFGGRP